MKVLLFFLLLQSARANTKPSPLTCGQAKVIEGTSCQDLKLELDLRACGIEEPPRAPWISCAATSAVAGITVGKKTFRVRLKQEDIGWGRTEWNVVSPVFATLMTSQPKAKTAVLSGQEAPTELRSR